jgi:Fungal specific transcription factor domain
MLSLRGDGKKTGAGCIPVLLSGEFFSVDVEDMLTGCLRIATDLNLHQVSSTKPQTEKQEREILNRRRVWMICFNLDRSTATQFGKPSTIKEDLCVFLLLMCFFYLTIVLALCVTVRSGIRSPGITLR